jgi:transketolase
MTPDDRAPALARKVRERVLRMSSRARSSHIGSCFSAAELLAVLYGEWLRVDPREPQAPARDRFILSKGHACAALYAVLAERGFFPVEWLDSFYQDGSRLPGHVTVGVPGVEISTGALGHGLAIGAGMALAGKRDNALYRVVVMLSDGECDEGATWEAALLAPHHRLDNLTAIVDYNKIQSLGWVKDILDLEPLADKWRAFGWSVREIDGHDVDVIRRALGATPFEQGRPSCLVAHTIKGKGVSFMEGQLLWHYRAPDQEELARALAELHPE